MNHYVYLLRSDQHHYIGIRSCHGPVEQDRYMGSGTAIKCARAAGVSFEKTILCTTSTREEAVELEAALMTEETLHEPGCLNLRKGGTSGRGMPGRNHSEKVRAGRLLGKKRSTLSPIHKSRISESLKGNHNGPARHSEETKQKIALALLGRKHTTRNKES